MWTFIVHLLPYYSAIRRTLGETHLSLQFCVKLQKYSFVNAHIIYTNNWANLNNCCLPTRSPSTFLVTSFTEAMSSLVKVAVLFLATATAASATALDDYVWKADENYKWVDMVSEKHLLSSIISKQLNKLISILPFFHRVPTTSSPALWVLDPTLVK